MRSFAVSRNVCCHIHGFRRKARGRAEHVIHIFFIERAVGVYIRTVVPFKKIDPFLGDPGSESADQSGDVEDAGGNNNERSNYKDKDVYCLTQSVLTALLTE